MSIDPVILNPVTVNEDLTKAVGAATDAESIRAAVMTEAEKQTADSQKLATDQAAAEAARAAAATTSDGQTYSRVEIIGGREFTFEAASELELERTVNIALKTAYAVQSTETHTDNTVDPPAPSAEEIQKKADADAAAMAELNLKFKRGDITAAEYIEQSGEMDRYLANKGIPIDSLKKAVDANEQVSYTQSWADATERFLNTPAGEKWPGGNKNLKIMGMKIVELGLEDAPDKVAALAQAFEALKQDDVLYPFVPPVDAAAATTAAAKTAAPATAPATTTAAPAVPAAAREPAKSSSVFGASSGTFGATAPLKDAPTRQAADAVIPKDASPAEILEAWKKAQTAAGVDPNSAFVDHFSSKR